MSKPENISAIELSFLMGQILLENGAEISRIQDTMERVVNHYNVENFNVFVLTNAIMATGTENGKEHSAKLKFTRTSSLHLGRVAEINQISREICENKYNIEEASKYGIKVGVYFFSTAVTEKEALKKAAWVAEFISEYQILYPVAYNCEGFGKPENRQYSLSKTQRTDLAIVFLDRINEYGYRPMFYGAKNELEDDKKWETSRLESLYKIWVAQYPSVPYPTTEASSYAGKYDMWQYTNQGIVPGIQTAVDMNAAYFAVY